MRWLRAESEASLPSGRRSEGPSSSGLRVLGPRTSLEVVSSAALVAGLSRGAGVTAQKSALDAREVRP